MTDLTKGIIEIDGFELNSSTTIIDIENNLSDSYVNCATSRSGKVSIFTFKKVILLGQSFDVDVTFVEQKISSATLYSQSEEKLTYEERFQADCYWLKDTLGEPSKINEDGNSYYYDDLHIYSFIQRDLSKNPAETYIVCKYSR